MVFLLYLIFDIHIFNKTGKNKKMDSKTEPRSRNKKNEKAENAEIPLEKAADSKNAEKNEKKTDKRPDKKAKKKSNTGWVVTAFSMTFVISAVLSAASDKVSQIPFISVSVAVLIFIIALGILFDIVGMAVTTAEIKAFNSMAARRLKTGQKAVWLINNAEKVSSFCNDIIGDIAGIVSGATSAGIAIKLFSQTDADIAFLLTLALTALVSAVTVGGKAIGKSVAIKHNTSIVMAVAKILSGFRK